MHDAVPAFRAPELQYAGCSPEGGSESALAPVHKKDPPESSSVERNGLSVLL